MMIKPFTRRFISGFLVVILSLNMGVSVALAQSALSSLVTDTTGAIVAASISCNKNRIQSGIKNLFEGTATTAASTAASAAAGAASGAVGGGSSNPDQLVHLAPTDPTNKNLQEIANATQAQTDKITCTNAIAKAAAGVILRQITLSTVNWINHGFNGNPLYATDTGSLLKSIGDQAVRSFNTLIGYDNLNYPFGRTVIQNLARELQAGFAKSAKYSLDAVIAQRYPGKGTNDFLGNFGTGGWDAFAAQFDMQNNPIGFQFTAQSELASQLAGTSYSPAQDIRDALQRSGGFLDIKVCIAPTTYDPARSPQRVAEDQNSLQNNPDYSGPNANLEMKAALQKDIVNNTCTKWQTQTPGAVIAHALNTTIDIPSNQLINGQDLSADITAIFNALANQLINKGLSALAANDTQNNSNFVKNSSGIAVNTQTTDSSNLDVSGSWASQGRNFNVFTDIPEVLRFEDNTRDDTTLAPGCTSADGFNSKGQFCTGDRSKPEGYQQVLQKEAAAAKNAVAAIYELDYCVPGPHPGWQMDASSNVQSFVSNPTLFPASASKSDVQKLLTQYGSTTGTVVGIVAGVAIGAAVGSAVPGLGTAIGAVVGAIVGAVLQMIGNDVNTTNEHVYGDFMNALMGIEFEYSPDGGGREHLNGHDPSANILVTLETRFEKAMAQIYRPTQSTVDAAVKLETPSTGTSSSTVAAPGAAAAASPVVGNIGSDQIAKYQGAFYDISDLTALDDAEFPKIQNFKDAVDQNQALLSSSISVENRLQRLIGRIDALPSFSGYPGLTGSLDIVPTISLKGNKIITLNQYDSFTDPGATAYDNEIGQDISKNVVSVSNVDTSNPGVYTITYDVSSKSGIAANQVVRSVRVLDGAGRVGDTVPNYALNNDSTLSSDGTSKMGASGSYTTTSSGAAVRDYNADLQKIKNITNISHLTPYEIELKKISDTFTQLSSFIHSAEDIQKEEAVLNSLQNEIDSINGTNGALSQCVAIMRNPNSAFRKDGGPADARVAFSFVTTNDGTIQTLPSWLTSKELGLPPVQSFLPDWHYAQGSGIMVVGLHPFPSDGGPDDPAGIKDAQFFFPNYDGRNMKITGGANHIATNGPVTLDYNKVIKNDDVATINKQPVRNAIEGLEHVLAVY